MKKKTILFIFTLAFIVIFTSVAFAIDEDTLLFENIDYKKSDNIRVLSDGNQITFDVKPQIINGRTLVPMRAIFESVGLTVLWNDLNQTAYGSNNENSIAFTIGSNKVIVNNQEKSIDVPASILNGRTMVPLRFLSENMGYNVVWVGESNLILMSKQDIVEWRYEGFEIIEPYKEYEVKYVNGVRTTETRYNGRTHEPEIKWLLNFEDYYPYREYELKYINGVATGEKRYTGTYFDYDVKYGSIEGVITWQYNKFIGTKPDTGANVVLIPIGLQPSDEDNVFCITLKQIPNGERNIFTTTADGYGYYEINDVPKGLYALLIVSNNTNSDMTVRYSDIEWLKCFFTEEGVKNLEINLKLNKYKLKFVDILEDRTIRESYDFGYTYF